MLTQQQIERKAARALKLAPAAWEAWADKASPEVLQEVGRHLDAVAERAAVLGTYLEERHGYGYGEQGHGAALKAANKAGRVVWRKALGYNAYHDLAV